jgi:hypothetical protein
MSVFKARPMRICRETVMFQVRVDDNPRSQASPPSCALLVVGLTVCLDNMFIASIFCLSSAQVARRLLSLVGCSRATYMRYHNVTAAFVRLMSPSKGSTVFYRKFDRQKSRQAIPMRRTCGRSYIPPSFPTILRTTYPVHVSGPPRAHHPRTCPGVLPFRVRIYLYSVS